MAERVVRVRIAEFEVADAPAVLKILGLGSCVAVALYDPGLRLGGLAHILLPGPAPERAASASAIWNANKFADHAIAELTRTVIDRGGERGRLLAKIAGGAVMFAVNDDLGDYAAIKPGIGERNLAAVREHLARLGIPLVAEDVGGGRGRTVAFDTSTGRLLITHARGGSQVI